MITYVEATTLQELAKKVNATGGIVIGAPAPMIWEHLGDDFTRVTRWVQGVMVIDQTV